MLVKSLVVVVVGFVGMFAYISEPVLTVGILSAAIMALVIGLFSIKFKVEESDLEDRVEKLEQDNQLVQEGLVEATNLLSELTDLIITYFKQKFYDELYRAITGQNKSENVRGGGTKNKKAANTEAKTRRVAN